ncbi:unnamed protein product [Prunus armeniaca]
MVVVWYERIGCYSHDKRRGELGEVVDLVRCWWSSCGYGWLGLAWVVMVAAGLRGGKSGGGWG